jgi:phosphoribosylformylglycinamidine synthase subunit PurQ / glutaminase
MKFGVIVFPGSNCDRDVIYLLETILQQETHVLWHKNKNLEGFDTGDCIILPGGFSYGDYLRTGAIARFSPIMNAVTEFANAGGYLFGICNGFQILCESGLLPGTLLMNSSQKFSCKNVYLKPVQLNSPLTCSLNKDEVLKIPIAHADGRYFADDANLASMEKNGQIIFKYCDEKGNITTDANPNGSLLNIAGISNTAKNVFGMMPHPERADDKQLGNTDGLRILNSILAFTQSRRVETIAI